MEFDWTPVEAEAVDLLQQLLLGTLPLLALPRVLSSARLRLTGFGRDLFVGEG